MTKQITLPEVPPQLSAEQMDLMTDDELKAEDNRRYDLMKQVEDIEHQFSQAWMCVVRYKEKRAEKNAIRAEVLAEIRAGWKGDEKLPKVNTNTKTL